MRLNHSPCDGSASGTASVGPGKAPVEQLFVEITEAAGQARTLCHDVRLLAEILRTKRLNQGSIENLVRLVDSLFADRQTPFQIPKVTQIENGLEKAGVGKLVVEVKTNKPDPKRWTSMFQYAWLSSTLDAVCEQDPDIRGFMGTTPSHYVDDFTRLDEERISIAAARVRRAHGERAVAAMGTHSLRHTYRSWLDAVGTPIAVQQKLMRHADVRTTINICGEVERDRMRKAHGRVVRRAIPGLRIAADRNLAN